ncbi:hypothetical protein [Streptomyces sp. NPDC003717]|uniref:hypothetical protein n=1 Tax=Streptomyces sp. NPDC003717 TaxID=3154276 RepID=UPI0033A6CF3E
MSLGDDQTSGGYGETRTRLPDPPGDPRRPPRSSSRSLITVVGVVVLLIAAIAFANRGDDEDSPSKPTTADKPSSTSTSPTGTTPVSSGYAHDDQGAQSAAANYAVALVSADILKPTKRAEIVQRVFVADKQNALRDKLDKAYSKDFLGKIGLDDNGNATDGTYVSRTMPIGTKTTAYSDSTATVDVWCTGVFGTAGEKTTNPVSSDWFTMTLQLHWTDNDWKVDSFSQKDGPAPVPGDNKASSADEMSKAVEEYGGFTYAR